MFSLFFILYICIFVIYWRYVYVCKVLICVIFFIYYFIIVPVQFVQNIGLTTLHNMLYTCIEYLCTTPPSDRYA